jgi:hypothetical protein
MTTAERAAWAVAALDFRGIAITTTPRPDGYLDVRIVESPLSTWRTQVEIARDFRAMHVPIQFRTER